MSIRTQLINVSHTLVSDGLDFSKRRSTFFYHNKDGRRMEVKNVYDGSLYTIDILQYDDRGCTSSGPILRKTYKEGRFSSFQVCFGPVVATLTYEVK